MCRITTTARRAGGSAGGKLGGTSSLGPAVQLSTSAFTTTAAQLIARAKSQGPTAGCNFVASYTGLGRSAGAPLAELRRRLAG